MNLKIFSSKHTQPGARRSSALRLAIITSGLSKFFGLALQAIAIPLVYHALGQHRYELYLLLTAALATITIAQMGAGPGLTQGIANAHARGQRGDEASLLSAAFHLVGIAALLGGALISLAIHLLPPQALFGAIFAPDRAEIISVMDTCVIVLMAQIIFGVVDSALAGYQEQGLTNIGSMFANILNIGILIAICHFAPSISAVIVALYGLPTLARVVNLWLLFKRRPYLLTKLTQRCTRFYRLLFGTGFAFWLILIGGVFEQNGGTFLLARLSSTQGTNLFAIVFKNLTLAQALVGVLTQPLWPAFTDAIAHRDIAWIRRAYTKIRSLLTIYSCVVALVLALAGQWIFRNLMHVKFDSDGVLFPILGAYFVANTWTHLFYVTMMGMSGIWKIAVILLAENLLMLLFGIPLSASFGASGMAIAYLAASLCLPVWLLPRMMRKRLEDISAAAQNPIA